MGKGDKKTKRGKIVNGSYGRLRRRKKLLNKYVKPVVAEAQKEEKVKAIVEKQAVKKVAPRKTTTKKPVVKKTAKVAKPEEKETKKHVTKKTTAKKAPVKKTVAKEEKA